MREVHHVTTRPTYGQLSVSAALAAGDAPVRVYQGALESGEVNGKPGDSKGIDVSGSYLPQFTVALNRAPDKVSKYLRIETLVDSDTFTVTLDGSPTVVVATPGATLTEVLSQIAADIDALPGFAATVVTDPTLTDGNGDPILEVLIQAEAAFTLAFSAASSAVADFAEATSVTYVLWARTTLNTGDAFGAWFPLTQELTVTDNDGDRINARGSDRIYMQVSATDGRVYLFAGVPGPEFPT